MLGTRDMERGGRKANRGSEESYFLVLPVTSSLPATWPQTTELWLAQAVTRPCGHTAPGEQRHLAPSSQGINSVVRRQYQILKPCHRDPPEPLSPGVLRGKR